MSASAFLQGLLLMPPEAARRKLPAAGLHVDRWHRWCADRQLAPLAAALSIVKGFAGVQACVVGVDSVKHLEDIVDAWNRVPATSAPGLATHDLEVIDPRRWKVQP
jgi:aryl-alcohol dehydrogenase-like predicted oxidoreductase